MAVSPAALGLLLLALPGEREVVEELDRDPPGLIQTRVLPRLRSERWSLDIRDETGWVLARELFHPLCGLGNAGSWSRGRSRISRNVVLPSAGAVKGSGG